MNPKIGFWLLWGAFLLYAFLLAPPDDPNNITLIKNLAMGEVANINPLIVALFNIMGVWPMIYACVLLIDGRGQKVRAWPFVLGSLAVGAFMVLPYLALRQSNPEFVGAKNWLIKLLDSRWTGIILTAIAISLVAYGVKGDGGDFIHQWQTNRFIHVMGLDFALLTLLFPSLLGDDLARRGLSDAPIFWGVRLIPLFGPLVYLSLRPGLIEVKDQAPFPTLTVPDQQN